MPYSLSVTEGSSYNLSASDTSSNLSLGLMGPSGPSGPAGLPDAITFEGADPNIPQTITVTGTLTDGTASVVFPTLIFAGYTFGGTAPLYTSHGGTYGLPNEYYLAYDEAWELVKVASGAIVAAWVDDSATADITAIDNDFNPQGTAVGYPEIITGLSLQGTYLGQLCLASGGWWKWNGDVWEEEASGGGGGVTDHGALDGLGDDDHTQYINNARGDARYITINGNAGTPSSIVLTNATGNAAALSVNFAVTSLYANDAGMAGGVARSGIITALLSDPLPISSGGTGAASESAARTALKVPGSIAGAGGSIAISNIVSITLANYNLIGTKDPTTLYVING